MGVGSTCLSVGQSIEMWETRNMAVLKVDDRYRIVLDREVREKLKIEPGDKVLALASTEGVLITNLKGRKFESLHPGFNYTEEKHEASRYLFRETKKKKN